MKRGAGDDLLALCKDVLRAAGHAEAEIWVRTRERGCSRLAIGRLTEHMGLHEVEARVRVAQRGRVAEVTTTELSQRALVDALHDADRLAPHAAELEGFAGFADGAAPTPEVVRWSDATADASDEERSALAARIAGRIEDAGLVAAGMIETETHAVAVATTAGCARAHQGTYADLRVWALEDAAGRGASGHGSHLCRDVTDLAIDREITAAIRTARDSANPGRVDAGTWDVVMEAPAVAELLEWLAMIGAGAPEVEQGTSFFTGRMNERITGEQISIMEDPLSRDDGAIADPFDREGTPRRAVSLVERGVAKSVLYDRVHAARAGATSTGSALPPDFGSPGGVGAVGLALGSGSAKDADELVSGMKRGLYIRRLNYVNGFIEPRRAVMTGLSRDGCFLVENGRIVRGVGNVRMTDSFLEMLERADAMTRARTAIAAAWSTGGALLVPAVRFRGVRFTSGSRIP